MTWSNIRVTAFVSMKIVLKSKTEQQLDDRIYRDYRRKGLLCGRYRRRRRLERVHGVCDHQPVRQRVLR